MRRIWGERGAGDMKGRKNLPRVGIVLGLGALLCAGVMASGALGMALVDSGSTDTNPQRTRRPLRPTRLRPTAARAPPIQQRPLGHTTSTGTITAPLSTDTATTTATTTTTGTSAAFTPAISSDQVDYAPGSTSHTHRFRLGRE